MNTIEVGVVEKVMLTVLIGIIKAVEQSQQEIFKTVDAIKNVVRATIKKRKR